MRELLLEMTSTGPLVATGGSLLFVGLLLWHFPRVYRGIFEQRASYTVQLRAAGEEERAQKLQTETDALRKRVPAIGRVLFGVGVVALIASIFAHS